MDWTLDSISKIIGNIGVPSAILLFCFWKGSAFLGAYIDLRAKELDVKVKEMEVSSAREDRKKESGEHIVAAMRDQACAINNVASALSRNNTGSRITQ